jgi:hypothetical protein
MSGVCSAHGVEEKCSTGFWWAYLKERDCLEDIGSDGLHITICLEETGCKVAKWIRMAQDRDKQSAVVNRVMNLRVPQRGNS